MREALYAYLLYTVNSLRVKKSNKLTINHLKETFRYSSGYRSTKISYMHLS